MLVLILTKTVPVIAAARVSTIVVDSIVLTVTLIKTWQTQLNARRLHMKVPLTTMLIRDGEYPTSRRIFPKINVNSPGTTYFMRVFHII